MKHSITQKREILENYHYNFNCLIQKYFNPQQ